MSAIDISVIDISPSVQKQICRLAYRVREGESTGGVLLGQSGPEGIRITGFWQGVESSPDVAGYWRTRWNPGDAPAGIEGEGLCLAISPVTAHQAKVLAWYRDSEGQESEPRTFTIGREALLPPPLLWLSLLSAAGLALAWFTVEMIRAEWDIPAAKIALALQNEEGRLRVQWKESGTGPAARVESASLRVRQGAEEEIVNLLDRYAPDGNWAFPQRAREVVVSLRIRRAGQPALMQTVTFVDSTPARR